MTGPPVESEIKGLSGFLTILEKFPDLEAAIIKTTKINKVLKAILKLESIPQEEEYNFKPRSRTLLDKWNKALAAAAAAAPATGPTNGANGTSEKKDTPAAEAPKPAEDVKQSIETAPVPEAASKSDDKPAAEVSKRALQMSSVFQLTRM